MFLTVSVRIRVLRSRSVQANQHLLVIMREIYHCSWVGPRKRSRRTNHAGFWIFVGWKKERKIWWSARKICTATRQRRFDEYSKSCIEKLVVFTKNPVCAYIIFICANRTDHFFVSFPILHCDFSWIFRENENFFVFFVPSKILRGAGFVAFILRLVGVRS